MKETIELRELYKIIDDLPNGSVIASIGYDQAPRNGAYGGLNDFTKTSEYEYTEGIHVLYGLSIFDVLQDLIVETNETPKSGIKISSNGNILHEWSAGELTIIKVDDIKDIQEIHAERYIRLGILQFLKALNTITCFDDVPIYDLRTTMNKIDKYKTEFVSRYIADNKTIAVSTNPMEILKHVNDDLKKYFKS